MSFISLQARLLIASASLCFIGIRHATAQDFPWQIWEVIDSTEVPAAEFDTFVLQRFVREVLYVYPDYNLRHIYYLRFAEERSTYSGKQTNFDWPVDPDTSFIRPFFDTRANFNVRNNSDGSVDTSWSFSGRLSLAPGQYGTYGGYFSSKVPAEFVFTGAPIYYSGRSFKSGVYARYGFFLQEVHPIYHPPFSATAEVKSLQQVFPNPFQSTLTIALPVGVRAGAASVMLYDVAGRLAWSRQLTASDFGQQQLVLRGLDVAPGMYRLVLVPAFEAPYVATVMKAFN